MQNPDFNEKRRNAETNDLIYEGIATPALFLHFSYEQILKQTTWFTKGLRRHIAGNISGADEETNDLIYEGIATGVHIPIRRGAHAETNDLIYEGIATLPPLNRISDGGCKIRNKRPDLRRDCDKVPGTFVIKFPRRNKRPDLRRDCDFSTGRWNFRPDSVVETNDLIYEGIATKLFSVA